MAKENSGCQSSPREYSKQLTNRDILETVKGSSEFFGEEIAIPDIPDEFFKVEKRVRELGFSFDPLILPHRIFQENDSFWYDNFKFKPPHWLFSEIDKGIYPQEVTELHAGLYLIDWRTIQKFGNGPYRYENDEYMEKLIERLRVDNKIKRDIENVPNNSRFGAIPTEIDEVILPELAGAIGKDILGAKGKIMVTPYIVTLVAWHMLYRYKGWGQTDRYELYGDSFGDDRRLFGGSIIRDGNIAKVHPWDSHRLDSERRDDLGFRPMISFHGTTIPEGF